MEQPIREIKRNQKDIYVTLDNLTAMMQEISTTQDAHTETLASHTQALTDLKNEIALSRKEQSDLLKQILEKLS
jgi:formate dehydrogenase assembly factor FdhD